jgi:hypothetical protein
MADREILSPAEKREKRIVVSKDQILPYNPAYKHMSKADFIKAEAERIEKKAKIKAYEDSLNKPEKKEDVIPEGEPIQPAKKLGRPKKID